MISYIEWNKEEGFKAGSDSDFFAEQDREELVCILSSYLVSILTRSYQVAGSQCSSSLLKSMSPTERSEEPEAVFLVPKKHSTRSHSLSLHTPETPKNNACQANEATHPCSIYNSFIDTKQWPNTKPRKVRVPGDGLKKNILKASKLLKSEADWLTMLNGWHSHDFYSGRSGRFTGQPNLEMLLRKNLYEELYELGLSVSEGEYKDPDTKMAETIKGLDEILASI